MGSGCGESADRRVQPHRMTCGILCGFLLALAACNHDPAAGRGTTGVSPNDVTEPPAVIADDIERDLPQTLVTAHLRQPHEDDGLLVRYR